MCSSFITVVLLEFILMLFTGTFVFCAAVRATTKLSCLACRSWPQSWLTVTCPLNLCRSLSAYCVARWTSKTTAPLVGRWVDIHHKTNSLVVILFVDHEKSPGNSPRSLGIVHDVSDFARTSIEVRYRSVEGGRLLHTHGFVGAYASC